MEFSQLLTTTKGWCYVKGDRTLSYGDQCIIARNQNEIRDLEQMKNRLIKDIDEAVSDLRKQNREILGR